MTPLSNTYRELVVDELIGLDFPLETANQMVDQNLTLVEEAEFAGRNAISVAEELAEYRQADSAVTEMQASNQQMDAANKQTAQEFTPYRVLKGHDSIDTAYVIDDYPFGYRVRCRQRHWMDTIEKGTHKGKMRHFSQTTARNWNHLYTNMLHKLNITSKGEHAPPGHDDLSFEERFKKAVHDHPEFADLLSRAVWNAPKASTSHSFMFLFLDEFGRVSSAAIEPYAGPEQFHKFRQAWRINTPTCQFDEKQLKYIQMFEKASRTYNPNSWKEWEAEHGPMEPVKVS